MYIDELRTSQKVAYQGARIELPVQISIDSRSLRNGQLFLALKGENTDGHCYIKNAIEKGAVGIIGDKDKTDLSMLPSDFPCVLVEDTSAFITELALSYLDEVQPEEIIAITGSVGKTTTREITRELLGLEYKVHGPISSFNTRLGCSLTVLVMPADTQILILEMGTSSPGEILEMTSIFKPTVAVVTEVREAHLSGFGNIEGVLKAKMEIVLSPRLKTFFYNSDNMYLSAAIKQLAPGIKAVSIGLSDGDINIRQPEFSIVTGIPNLSFQLEGSHGSIEIVTGLFGIHQASCLAMASAVALEMGVDPQTITRKAGSLKSQKGRGRMHLLSGNIIVIDDSYNANPASMSAALSTVSGLTWKGRKVVVLGSMKELGDSSTTQHRKIAESLNSFDVVMLVGFEWLPVLQKTDKMRKDSFLFMEDAKEVLDYLVKNIKENDMILIKGSNSNNLDLIVNELVKTS